MQLDRGRIFNLKLNKIVNKLQNKNLFIEIIKI